MTDSPWGPGTVLAGRFLLEDLLDETDGAYFWRATDEVLARSVGVHLLRADDPRADALLDAARTSALVSDMRLLRVLDAASAEGVVYVVNEWSPGLSLDQVIDAGSLPANRAAWVVREVAETITAAHRVGVAHGRLLPENVIVSEAGSVKLVGFVVDAVLRSPGGQRRVADGEPVSATESDVLNLAGLLYAALVGRWPGTEGSKIPTAPVEHGRPLRPRRVRAGVPRSLDALCARVLSDPPGTGTAIDTAHEVHAALSDYIGDPTGSSVWTPGPEPTVALERDAEPEASSRRATDDPDGVAGSVAASDGPSGDDAEAATVAVPWPVGGLAGRPGDGAAGTGDDPDATQAAPMVFDDDSGSLRPARPQSAQGSRSAGPGRRTPAGRRPAPDPPVAAPRPLFVDDAPTTRTAAPASAGGGSPATGDEEDTGSFIGGFGGFGALPATGTSRGQVSAASQEGARDGGPGAEARRSGWREQDPPDHAPLSAGTGATWGPDPDPDHGGVAATGDSEAGDRAAGDAGARRRGALRAGVLLLVVALVTAGTIVALNLRGGTSADPTPTTPSGDASSSQAPSSRPVAIADVSDFDPEGDPSEENPDLVALAHDGNPATAWRTVVYERSPRLGNLKSGVGLLVDLGRQVRVSEVRLRLLGRPTAVRILTDPGAARAPSDVTGLRAAARAPDAGERARLRFGGPVRTRWLVVWLTSLPPNQGGYQGQVAEVTVRS